MNEYNSKKILKKAWRKARSGMSLKAWVNQLIEASEEEFLIECAETWLQNKRSS